MDFTESNGYISGFQESTLPAVFSGSEGTTAGALVSGFASGISVQHGGFLRAVELVTGEQSAHVSGLPETSIDAMLQAATACTAAGLLIAEDPPIEPSYGDFTIRNMTDLEIPASSDDIYTTLSIRYDYDWSKREFRKALLLEAPSQIKVFGRVPYTLEAKWLKSPRQAYLLGERMLGYLSRPRWGVPFTTGIDAAAIPPGVWAPVNHPHVPASGRMLVLNSELDPSSASVRLTVEAIVGAVPEIVLAKLSEAYAPQLPDGISVTYISGHAIFAIMDEDGKPIIGAKVTLDGGLTLPTDTSGKVSFQTGRGVHHLKIEATGYVTQELDVTI
jgi:hypothetical protein